MTERARLGWVIVYVPDVEDAVALYERAFGLKRRFVSEEGDYGELDTGATTLAFTSEGLAQSNLPGGFRRPDLEGEPFNVEIALVFDDVEAAFAHAVAAGCLPLVPPKNKPWGQLAAYVRDPFGTLVELAAPLS